MGDRRLARDAAAELKEHATQIAQDSTPIELKAFDISSLPAGSNGWTASPTSKLSPGLKIWKNLNSLSTSNLRLLDWDGVYVLPYLVYLLSINRKRCLLAPELSC
ncbi:MAG: hypothetical protein NXY57DRAFT_970273 [Lentinula lateritia]|nr:MAG: hypothetical protein NXY57DRAFT_970273 [Lentinula lateritia]